jgi:hypothetical protein
MLLDMVSVHASVVFKDTIVLVVSAVIITSDPTAKIHAQTAPGIKKKALVIDPFFVSGISFMVDIISMSIDE